MKEEEKYIELLKELGRVIHEKNNRICMQDYEIGMLRDRLSDAERRIEEFKKGNKE